MILLSRAQVFEEIRRLGRLLVANTLHEGPVPENKNFAIDGPTPVSPIKKRRGGLEISRACWAVVRPECGNPSDLWLIEPARVRDRLSRAAGYERRVRCETVRHTRGRFPPAVANAVFSKPAPNNRSCKSSVGET